MSLETVENESNGMNNLGVFQGDRILMQWCPGQLRRIYHSQLFGLFQHGLLAPFLKTTAD